MLGILKLRGTERWGWRGRRVKMPRLRVRGLWGIGGRRKRERGREIVARRGKGMGFEKTVGRACEFI